jgi:ferredoxin
LSLITEVDMAPELRISVDHDVCVGNVMCESFALKVFVLKENRQSEVADPEADTAANILEAAENCPVSAITVVEEGTGETLFP